MEQRQIARQRRRKRIKKRKRIFCALLLPGLILAGVQALGRALPESRIGFQMASPKTKEGYPSFLSSGGREKKLLIDAPFFDQRENWPTGCESVSAVMALNYFGAEITVDEFIDGFLPRGNAPHQNSEGKIVGCDPRKAFSGDPRSEEGWGCCAPVIARAVQAVIDEKKLSLSVQELEGKTLEELFGEYLSQGVPVILWATIDMEPPQPDTVVTLEETGEQYQWYYPMHCLLLVGKDDESYYFNDPAAGKAVHYLKEAVEAAYAGLGSQAVAILPEK